MIHVCLLLQADVEQAVQQEFTAGITVNAAMGACTSSKQSADGACANSLGLCTDAPAGATACGTVAGEPVAMCRGLQRQQGRLTIGGRAHYFAEDGRDLGRAGRLKRSGVHCQLH